MFGKLKEKLGLRNNPTPPARPSMEILAPIEGDCVAMSEVPDPTFSGEILGRGIAIRPTNGRAVSPVDGTIDTIFDTGHAVSIHADAGMEILIHIGIDTVNLRGQGYNTHVQNGQRVKAGDLLITFDMESIQTTGYNLITPVIICNTDAYTNFDFTTGTHVAELDSIMRFQPSQM